MSEKRGAIWCDHADAQAIRTAATARGETTRQYMHRLAEVARIHTRQALDPKRAELSETPAVQSAVIGIVPPSQLQ